MQENSSRVRFASARLDGARLKLPVLCPRFQAEGGGGREGGSSGAA